MIIEHVKNYIYLGHYNMSEIKTFPCTSKRKYLLFSFKIFIPVFLFPIFSLPSLSVSFLYGKIFSLSIALVDILFGFVLHFFLFCSPSVAFFGCVFLIMPFLFYMSPLICLRLVPMSYFLVCVCIHNQLVVSYKYSIFFRFFLRHVYQLFIFLLH